MALHAGFAVALSISESAMQQFLHAAYVNDIIPASYTGQRKQTNNSASPSFDYVVAFDLVSAEPRVALAPNPGDLIQLELELFGPMTFTAPGKPTITCEVLIRATIGLPVVMIVDQKAKTARFGLDPSALKMTDITPFTVKRTSGADPTPIYGFDFESLRAAIWLAMLGQSKDAFLFTPPLLDQVLQLGYALGQPQLKLFDGAFSVGIDLSGKKKVGNVEIPVVTFGDVNQLVDLNTVSTAKGWKKTYSDALPAADDEYGQQLTTIGWTATVKRPTGSHNTQIAAILNPLVLSEFWDRLGRFEVVKRFEDEKHAEMLRKVKALRGHSTYGLPETARIVIEQIEATLIDDFLQIDGVATRFGSPEVTVGFHFKLRIVRTQVDGSTSFVVGNQSLDGLTAEILDVVVDKPGWITVLEVIGAVLGIVLAPFTAGASFVMMVLFELILSALVGSLLGNAESMLGSSIAANLPQEQGIIRFTWPGTTGPTLVVRPNDMVIKSSGVSAWLGLTTDATAARIYVSGGPGYYQPTYSWPVSNRKPIVVRFDDGDSLYNQKDSKVRIRWRVYAQTKANPISESDKPILSEGLVDPKRVAIFHASDALTPFDRFIVECRVYRPFGDTVHELLQQETVIEIQDRLLRDKPYVRWSHQVHYQDYSAKVGDPTRKPLGWASESRVSKIHRTDPDKRCRFADDYSQDLDKHDLDYLDDLPFALADIAQHRKKVCPYCFFGGPDKTVLEP